MEEVTTKGEGVNAGGEGDDLSPKGEAGEPPSNGEVEGRGEGGHRLRSGEEPNIHRG